jgi:hypothetical protein
MRYECIALPTELRWRLHILTYLCLFVNLESSCSKRRKRKVVMKAVLNRISQERLQCLYTALTLRMVSTRVDILNHTFNTKGAVFLRVGASTIRRVDDSTFSVSVEESTRKKLLGKGIRVEGSGICILKIP